MSSVRIIPFYCASNVLELQYTQANVIYMRLNIFCVFSGSWPISLFSVKILTNAYAPGHAGEDGKTLYSWLA